MSSPGFEPAIPAGERLQYHALDLAASKPVVVISSYVKTCLVVVDISSLNISVVRHFLLIKGSARIEGV